MSQLFSTVQAFRPSAFLTWGLFWFAVMILGGIVFFQEGLAELFEAWQLPEYSHGPLIPILSLLLFLRHLKTVPVREGHLPDRAPGFILMLCALAISLFGKVIGIGDIVAYGMILWVGSILLISWGWKQGKHFWSPILHLVYMLPLPGIIYFKVSTYLQGISSELGVYFLQLLSVPVFLEGNIIDLGVLKLHVAEACSGLRYLFPILSFSYIFAVVYRGPIWHKAVLLIAAAPITILMNSVRIAVGGVIVNRFGIEYLEGFTHFFEGWVIFLICIALLFLLAWVLLFFRKDRVALADALDVDTSGFGQQMGRLKYLMPSWAMIGASLTMLLLVAVWHATPKQTALDVARAPFAVFPTKLDEWQAGQQRSLDPATEAVLAADDYYSAPMFNPLAEEPVSVFMAWYRDQSTGGVHSPEVCLPGAGWEIAELQQIDAPFSDEEGFTLNRAVIQKDTQLMLVYFWYEQQGNRTASGMAAKLQLWKSKITTGRMDSAIVRLITTIDGSDGIAEAEARLNSAAADLVNELEPYIPGI